jgi:hypothetical protein
LGMGAFGKKKAALPQGLFDRYNLLGFQTIFQFLSPSLYAISPHILTKDIGLESNNDKHSRRINSPDQKTPSGYY